MRQVALLDGKVMQGELDRVTLLLRGAGEVTRVQGDQVLAWNVEPGANAGERRLVVQFNQPQKRSVRAPGADADADRRVPADGRCDAAAAGRRDAFRRLLPHRERRRGAARSRAGERRSRRFRPSNFPRATRRRRLSARAGEQRFAYRFSGADFALRIQADQILPELTVSQVLAYHHGENELSDRRRVRARHSRSAAARAAAARAERLRRRAAQRRRA